MKGMEAMLWIEYVAVALCAFLFIRENVDDHPQITATTDILHIKYLWLPLIWLVYGIFLVGIPILLLWSFHG